MPAAPLVVAVAAKLGNACVYRDSVGVECACNHIGECCNNDATVKIHAENQEQLAAGFADVLLNQQYPSTCPSFLTLKRTARRSRLPAPKNMPPSSTHSSTGSQPNAAA